MRYLEIYKKTMQNIDSGTGFYKGSRLFLRVVPVCKAFMAPDPRRTIEVNENPWKASWQAAASQCTITSEHRMLERSAAAAAACQFQWYSASCIVLLSIPLHCHCTRALTFREFLTYIFYICIYIYTHTHTHMQRECVVYWYSFSADFSRISTQP